MFVVEGYCNSDTTESQAGAISWPESVIGTIVNILCPFGPINATASRTCISRLNWGSPETGECATVVTQQLRLLGSDFNNVCTMDYILVFNIYASVKLCIDVRVNIFMSYVVCLATPFTWREGCG